MKTYYILDYQNGNKRIEEEETVRSEERKFIMEEQYTPEQLKEIKEQYNDFNEWIERKINDNLSPYLKGIVEAEQKPKWDDLRYDNEIDAYFLKETE